MVRRKKSEASLVNKTSLRVRFSEVDSMQIVWHGEYVVFLDSRGELQLLAPEFYRKWKERWEVK